MANLEDIITRLSVQRGIDPNYALRVARSEGGLNDPVRQSLSKRNGVQEPSYGPFQLLIGGGDTGFPEGLGNAALRAGIDPRDPNQAEAAIGFALDNAKRDGWGAWYGAKAAGITGYDGINRGMSIDSVPPAAVARGVAQGAVQPNAGGTMPPLPRAEGPTAVAATEPTSGLTMGDKLGSALFGDKAAGLKELFGTNAPANSPGKAGLGMLGQALGGGGDKYKERMAEASRLLPSNVGIGSVDAEQQGRAAAATQLMASVLSGMKKRKPVQMG